MKRFISLTTIVLFSILCYGQSNDIDVYRFTLEKYISTIKETSKIDTIYIRNDFALLTELPSVISNKPIKLVDIKNVSKNFIAFSPIESKRNRKKVSIIEYSVYCEDNYIGYTGGYCFVLKIKKSGNKILIEKIEKTTY